MFLYVSSMAPDMETGKLRPTDSPGMNGREVDREFLLDAAFAAVLSEGLAPNRLRQALR
jgi:hypothetical protein